MPALTLEAVHQFWHDYEDPMIYRVIAFMEGVEQWTLDHDSDVEQKLNELGQALEDISKIDISTPDDFIELAAYVRMGRTLRMLQIIDSAKPGAASKVLIHSEEVSQREDDTPGIFLRRNVVFERLRLLTRVFAPERLKIVLKSLEEEEI